MVMICIFTHYTQIHILYFLLKISVCIFKNTYSTTSVCDYYSVVQMNFFSTEIKILVSKRHKCDSQRSRKCFRFSMRTDDFEPDTKYTRVAETCMGHLPQHQQHTYCTVDTAQSGLEEESKTFSFKSLMRGFIKLLLVISYSAVLSVFLPLILQAAMIRLKCLFTNVGLVWKLPLITFVHMCVVVMFHNP